MRYAIYDPTAPNDAARIMQIVMGVEEDAAADATGMGLAYAPVPDTASDATHYIKPSTSRANALPVTPCTPSRTSLPADGRTQLTLSQMRADTHIRVSGPIIGEMTCLGSDTITFAQPGTYTITATAPFPALSKEIVINAT